MLYPIFVKYQYLTAHQDKHLSVISSAYHPQSNKCIESKAAGGRVDAARWLHSIATGRGRPNLRLGPLHSRTIMFHHFTLPNRGTAVLLMLYDPQDAEHPHPKVPLVW